MKILLALLALSALARAQESVQRPSLFAPAGQLLGGAQPGLPSKTPADFDKLVRRLGVKDPLARVSAINALGAPGNIRAVPFLGAVLLKLDEPLETRAAAAMALGRVGNWRAHGYLKQAIKDSAKEVRFATALALGKTGSRESLAPLTEALARDQEWWVRFAAAVALGDSRDPLAVEALGRAAAGESEWQVRMQAVRSLGRIGSRDAARALSGPLGDPDPGVRAAAALALGEIGGSQAWALLREAAAVEREDFPRRVMISTLGKLAGR